jgi:hypothetical protein
MADKEEKDKKIIIDEDWKQQAHKEKEKLSEQEKQDQKKTKKQRLEPGTFPKGDFSTLVSMTVTQTLFALGLIKMEGESDEGGAINLELARFNIEMLDSLVEKTKGNLTNDEKLMLETSLNELRMAYVKIAGI